MSSIHPSAVLSSQARIGRDVVIGPFSIIEDDVVIGDHCRLAGGVIVKNGTTLGENNIVDEGAVLGGRPQHARAPDRIGRLTIGNGNSIRENVTAHCALHEGNATYIGNNNLLMVNVHIGHDCQIKDHVIIANNSLLAGHTSVDDHAYLSGAVAMHQFCRIGQYAMVGGQAHVKHDVPPFVTVDGFTTQIVGLNIIGLRRHGFSSEEIRQLKAAYRVIYRSDLSWDEILAVLKRDFGDGYAAAFYPFLSTGERAFIRARQQPRATKVDLNRELLQPQAANKIRRAA